MNVTRDARRLVVGTFVSAVVLNFAWETAQAPLYEPMGTAWQATRRCFVASLGDGLMVLLAVAIGATLFRSSRWFVEPKLATNAVAAFAGLVIGGGVEQWGLTGGRWAYQVHMPRVPGTDMGVVPLAQMVILTPLSLWLAGRMGPKTTAEMNADEGRKRRQE